MAIVVEHEKRKHEILEKALDIFVSDGYENVTFQKIADKCGITRTTLYLYFKNKTEIFQWSIKQMLLNVEADISKVVKNDSYNAETMLRKTLEIVADAIKENQTLLYVLLVYLIRLGKTGENVNNRVNHRVIKIRSILNKILIKGIQNKEFKNLNVAEMNDLLYGILEAAIFRIAVLSQKDISDLKNSLNLAIDGLLI